jgi:hypothetical protein
MDHASKVPEGNGILQLRYFVLEHYCYDFYGHTVPPGIRILSKIVLFETVILNLSVLCGPCPILVVLLS